MVGILELLLGGGGDPRLRLGGEDTPAGGGLLDAVGQRIMQQQLNPQMGGAAPLNAAPQQAAEAPQSAYGGPQVSMPQSGGGGLLGRLFGGGQRQGENQTVQWLVSRGVDPGAAPAIAANPQMLRSMVAQLSGPQNAPKQSEYEQRSQALAQAGMDPNSEEGRRYFLTGDLPTARGGAAEMSLQTLPGVDEQGNPILLQVDKAGQAHRTKMPPGTRIQKAPMIKDTGTHFVVIDPITREVVQEIPKNVAGAAAQGEIGKGAGAAQLALPGAEGLAEQVKKQVLELSADPYLPRMLGPVDSRLPNVSSDAARVQGKMNQLQGGAFLQAREMLKGAGQVTDYEGRKAEEAYARLGTAQTVEDYKKALQDFNMYVDMGLKKLRAQASMGGGSTPQPAQQNDDPLGIRMR